ncbi:jerky-like protein [Trichonephila clavipes]|nr:jerky-like protein [Trichonephila clavipes]
MSRSKPRNPAAACPIAIFHTASMEIQRKAMSPNRLFARYRIKGGSDDFKTSTGWLRNFTSRQWMRELQIEGESLSGDKNSAHKFKEAFLQSVEEGYSRDDVYNVDETGLNWKALPRKSFASK